MASSLSLSLKTPHEAIVKTTLAKRKTGERRYLNTQGHIPSHSPPRFAVFAQLYCWGNAEAFAPLIPWLGTRTQVDLLAKGGTAAFDVLPGV